MISIEKVTIENFQSHKDTQITFSRGLNVIIGASDHGKSAIVRAIKWVLYNEPRGNDYIRQGTNYAKVTLKMSNGYTITRERTASKNRYILKDKEGNSSIFEGFGSEVPYEVVRAHGIPKVILDTDKKSCINIGEQLEGPFLISESGSLRAKAIGRMTGLHVLDKSIKDSAIDLRRENQTKDRLNNELEDIKDKLLEFKDLDILEEKLKQSKNIITKLENSIDKIEKLETKRLELEDIEKRSLKVNQTLSSLDKIYEGIELINNISLKNIKYKNITKHQINLNNIQKEFVHAKDIIDKTANVNKGIEIINIIDKKILNHQKVEEYQKRLNNVNKGIIREKEILDKTKDVYYVEKMVKNIEDGNQNIKKLKTCQIKYDELKKDLINAQKQIKACENINEAYDKINNIDEMLKLEKKLIDLNTSYKEKTDNIKKGLNYINERKVEIEKFLNEYIKILKDKSKCPLCDSLIGENMIENIIAKYREENK